jgi:fluoride exporter
LLFAASGKHGSVWREQRLRRGKAEAGESDGRRTELDEAVLNLSGWIFLGAGLGGVLRFLCSNMVARAFGETFPWGTLLVNVSGSFLIGLFAVVSGPDGRLLVGSTARQFVMVGVFGGYTTFSSFSLQTLALAQDGQWWLVAANIASSLVLCLAGVWLGFAAGVAVNR